MDQARGSSRCAASLCPVFYSRNMQETAAGVLQARETAWSATPAAGPQPVARDVAPEQRQQRRLVGERDTRAQRRKRQASRADAGAQLDAALACHSTQGALSMPTA